jgi:disulfide bond formation protein DsbB
MIKLSYRKLNSLAFLMILIILAIAAYLQLELKIIPCPLCILQRLVFVLLGCFFLFGSFYLPKHCGQKIFYSCIVFISFLGATIAGWQLWLQYFHHGEFLGCGASLLYMIQNFPLEQTIKTLLRGTADCGKITWTFLSISIAGWSFVLFAFFIIIGCLKLFSSSKK